MNNHTFIKNIDKTINFWKYLLNDDTLDEKINK
jgi:hypothetical protein